MCKSKMAVEVSHPNSSRRSRDRSNNSPRSGSSQTSRTPTTGTTPRRMLTSTSDPSTSNAAASSSANYTTFSDSTSRTVSSRTSLSSLRQSLPENPHIYDISEIRAATNNFLAKRYSSSSAASWRCSLRGRDVIVFQRKFRRKFETAQLRERLSVICRSHHVSIIKLLGASVSGEHIYLVYEFITGGNLADCLRNSKNPNFTVLSSWTSRMQIATDLAHGLDYIHNNTGLQLNIVHNRIKSSSIIVTEPNFNAKICHFGTAQLCGETEAQMSSPKLKSEGEITEVSEDTASATSSKGLTRSDSAVMQFQGVRGYMSPEFQSTGAATQKSDVYAFGVVILELLSGEEPLKYKFDKSRGDFVRTSVIETATAVIDGREDASGSDGGREGRLRQWVDRRLKDSFPVEVAEQVTRLALECVHVDPDKRPNMGQVAGKISKLYIKSSNWSRKLNVPTGISVSLAPR